MAVSGHHLPEAVKRVWEKTRDGERHHGLPVPEFEVWRGEGESERPQLAEMRHSAGQNVVCSFAVVPVSWWSNWQGPIRRFALRWLWQGAVEKERAFSEGKSTSVCLTMCNWRKKKKPRDWGSTIKSDAEECMLWEARLDVLIDLQAAFLPCSNLVNCRL